MDDAKENILIFQDHRMIVATDRNYAPPNPEVAANAYEFYAIKSSGPKTFGLIRVQRGKLKFMRTHEITDDNESIDIVVEDYAENRVRELVKMSAKRMSLPIARDRIERLLANPKLRNSPFQHVLEDWLLPNQTEEQCSEVKLRSPADTI